MKDRNLEGKERRYGLLSGRGAGYERMCCRLSTRCYQEWRRKTPSSAFEKEQDIAKQGKYWEDGYDGHDGHDGHERMRV